MSVRSSPNPPAEEVVWAELATEELACLGRWGGVTAKSPLPKRGRMGNKRLIRMSTQITYRVNEDIILGKALDKKAKIRINKEMTKLVMTKDKKAEIIIIY